MSTRLIGIAAQLRVGAVLLEIAEENPPCRTLADGLRVDCNLIGAPTERENRSLRTCALACDHSPKT